MARFAVGDRVWVPMPLPGPKARGTISAVVELGGFAGGSYGPYDHYRVNVDGGGTWEGPDPSVEGFSLLELIAEAAV